MTQGLVSIIDQRGRVLFKLVTGADGYMAPDLARRAPAVLAAGGGALELARLAIDLGFGEEHGGSFVVQTPERDLDGSGEDVTADLAPAYRERFYDPRWNPRWAQGTAEYAEVVQVDVPGPLVPAWRCLYGSAVVSGCGLPRLHEGGHRRRACRSCKAWQIEGSPPSCRACGALYDEREGRAGIDR